MLRDPSASGTAGRQVHVGRRRIGRSAVVLLSLLACAAAGGVALRSGVLAGGVQRMDDRWVAVLASKDYLFPTEWTGAWIVHGAIVCALVSLALWRQRLGVAARHERAIVTGALGLVAVFLASLPFVAAGVALAVQAQVSRVLWPVETLATLFVVWAAGEAPVGPRAATRVRPARLRGAVLVAVLALATVGRGIYVTWLERDDRSLFRPALPGTAWTETLRWVRAHTPPEAGFLADPAHAWKYGVSFRVGAERDVYLEEVKDTAMALYSREVAARVLERIQALGPFDALTAAHVESLRRRYHFEYFVARAAPTIAEACLGGAAVWRNREFVVCDVRGGTGVK
jgi:hypothetical protein